MAEMDGQRLYAYIVAENSPRLRRSDMNSDRWPMTTNQWAAAAYARRGVRIVPAREADSAVGPVKSPYVPGGFKSASAEIERIAEWWNSWPSAIVGLPCRANGIIVLDADRHGLGDGVADAFALFERCGLDSAAVPVVITPRDGRHFIFRRPDTLGDTKGNVARAIDVRDNAYVIAAGSVLSNGRRYELATGTVGQLAAAIAERSLPILPPVFSAMIAKPVRPHSATGRSAVPLRFPANPDLRPRLAGLIRTVAKAKPGQRNSTLHWAACRAGELVDAGLLSACIAEVMLVEAGAFAGLPCREALATVRSGLSTSREGQIHGG